MRAVRGFTLIELLIVVVIIGILASIAIPKFANTKEKAYVATMKSDLRNLQTAQETYFSDYVTYTTSLGTRYTPSTGVTVTVISATGSGWSASSSHNATTKTCGIYYGSASPVISGQNESEPRCN